MDWGERKSVCLLLHTVKGYGVKREIKGERGGNHSKVDTVSGHGGERKLKES